MAALLRRFLPLVALAIAALWLRTHDLARRPMHADEANQAVKFGQLLESGHYAFDPSDHHGPTLYYAALPIAWWRGEHSLAAIDETTVRLVPAIAGTLAVLLLYGLALPLGRLGAFVAAALLAVAPPAVYYSRYFIQETLLLTFALGAFVAARAWWRTDHLRWAAIAGACVGLMQATKASAPLFWGAALIASLLVLRIEKTLPPTPKARIAPALGVALAAAAAIFVLFYSSFGTHWSGVRDAFAALGQGAQRATGPSGHEKPWFYYLQLFAWVRNGGLVFQQLAFLALAAAGAALAWTRLPAAAERSHPTSHYAGRHLLRWAALSTLLVVIALSVVPYKTPWHAIHLVPGFALLAAGALAFIPRAWLALGLAAAIVFLQFKQTQLAVFLRPADARNPYAYVHSSPDVRKVRALAATALERQPNGVIRIVSEEYWPLPWYLRDVPRVGYWTTIPDDCDGALVIASASHADEVRNRLHGRYRESFLGLRPGFLCVVFTPAP